MLSDLFINACILIATIFINVEFLQNERIKKLSTIKRNILSGVLFSITSMLLMKYNIYVTEDSFLDFRNVSQSTSAFYGGPISSLVTGLLSALFRMFYFGIDKNSLLTFVNMTISAVLCAYIAKSMWSKELKWTLMIVTTNLIHMLLFTLVIDGLYDTLQVIAFLFIGTLLVSTVVYFVLDHLCIAHKEIARLKQQSTIDFLTGVHNTRDFDFLYNKSLRFSKERNEPFSVLMLDIDFFKHTNDTYGHIAGDTVLKELGNILNSFASEEDALVGRVGGEEFCILLRGYSKEKAIVFAEDLRKCIAENIFLLLSQEEIKITVSIGIAAYKETVFDIRNMREIADQRLYESKKTGRNKVCY